MATAGSIVIDLLMKTGSFETDTKRAEKRLKEMGKAAQEVGKVIGTAIASGAAIATTAVIMWTRDLVTASQEIRNFAQLANTTTDTFQRWAAGASSVGIQQDKLADIMKDMQDRVGDFMQTGGGPMADFFENIAPKVGVTAEQFAKLSGPGALQLFVDSLEKANVAQNDMVFYMEAIASDSTLLLPLLQNNGKAMRELGDQASALGGVLSNETLKAAEEMRQEMWELDQVMQGLRNEVAAGALPVMREFTDLMKDPQAIAAMRDTAELILAIGTAAAKAAVGFANLIGKYKEWLANQGFIATDDGSSMEQLVARQQKLSEQLGRPAFLNVLFGEDTEAELKKELDKVDEQIRGYAFRGVTSSVDSTTFGRGLNSGGRISAPAGTATKARTSATKELTEAEKQYQQVMETNAEIDRMAARYQTDLAIAAGDRMVAEDAANKARQEAFQQQIGDMQLQRELIGMTNLERERAIALAYLGADATMEMRDAILAEADALYYAREQMDDQTEAMDALRDSSRSFLDDLRDGVAPMDVLTEAAGRFIDKLWEIAANNLIEQAFGKQGESGGGAWGDAIGGFFGAIFGGAKAGGGGVLPDRWHLVGEQGPEMFVPRTAGTIIPAAQTAGMMGGGSGFNQTLQFALAAPTDPRTQQQIAQRVGFETQRATNRNR